jgi:hypothetical protein
MSAISQTLKVSTARILNIRNLNLLVVAALVVAIATLFAGTASPEAKPFDQNAYMLHRQGEWASVNIPTVDMRAYHLSERTLIDPNIGFSIYLLSERTFVDAQAGMAAYLNSERTSVPVNFTKYQRSEWFGE